MLFLFIQGIILGFLISLSLSIKSEDIEKLKQEIKKLEQNDGIICIKFNELEKIIDEWSQS